MKRRSVAIDMVKGLSIMTLFFLHFENGYFDFNYNFLIVRSPAFFIVVGWLWGLSSKDRTIAHHWQKRKQGLVKPYIWMSLIFIIFDILIVTFKLQNDMVLWRDIYKTLCLKGIGTLWFLPALLGGEILFLKMRDLKPWIITSSYFICLILIYMYNQWEEYVNFDSIIYSDILKAPVSVIVAMLNAYIYIGIAFYTSRHYGKRILAQSKKTLFVEGITLLLFAFIILNNLSLGDFAYNICFIIGSSSAGFGILLLFTSIETIGIIAKPLEYFGKNSLIVMAFHFCLLFQITLIFDRVVMGHDSYSGGITLVYFGFALIAQILLIEIINRKFKFIIGK